MSAVDVGLPVIAIIGGGCSGALLAIHLLQRNDSPPFSVLLVDSCERIGRGLAYGTGDDNLVLNVPAGNMSALADDPQHFVRYCRQLDPALGESSFVPRRIYGDYLEDILQQAITDSALSLSRVQAEVLAVHPSSCGRRTCVELADGNMLPVDVVVLATGHLPPVQRVPVVPDVRVAAKNPQDDPSWYIRNPWDDRVTDDLAVQDSVLVLGSGHTAVDTLFRITSHTAQRKVYLLSRRGLLAHVHRPQPPALAGQCVRQDFPSYLDCVPATARDYLHALRAHVREHEQQGGDWRDIIASLRSQTPTIWQRLPVAECSRFLRHAWTYWDIHRHRLAPSAHARLHRMVREGQVEVIAGRLQRCRSAGRGVDVDIRRRCSTDMRCLAVGKIINCTGPNYDISRSGHSLLLQLLAGGHIRQDALAIGLDVDECYAVIGRDGVPASALFYLGPMLRARYLEAIGVPELRVHAQRLARILVDRLTSMQASGGLFR